MIYCPEHYRNVKTSDCLEEFAQLKGSLNDKEAKITLARFLRQNLGLTSYLLSGMRLEPYQEMTIKGFMNRNFSMCVWTRGGAKTTVAAIYAFLQCVFEPNTNILLAGPTFRTSRFIFEKIESLVDSQQGRLLAQCFGAKVRRNDLFEWKINGGSIKAIPLNGEKIRGFRASVLILDEFLLLPEELVKTVLMPFLVAPHDAGERIRIRKLENALIRAGKMHEDERIKFESNIKMICLSSASYTFEYLYKLYQDWSGKILEPDNPAILDAKFEGKGDLFKNAKYFVSQLSYEAIPEHLIDKNIIAEAKGDLSDAIFDREYGATFTDGSTSYFSAEKMNKVTFKIGESPFVQAKGSPHKKYLLSIDPSFSNSPSSDFFSMSVFELDDTNQTGTLVHNYAKAGMDLKNHIEYFYYLVTYFNIVYIVLDNSDGNFVQAANESSLFKENKIQLGFFDFDSELEGVEYNKELVKARKSYNLESKIICTKQHFSTNFIRRANELLQTNIDRKRVFFGSNINGNDIAMDAVIQATPPLNYVQEDSITDFIDTLDLNMYGTKSECVLIEIKTSANGIQTFDLPLKLKKSTAATRARKDRYTTLLLGNWGIKCYYDIITCNVEKRQTTFIPFMV